MIEICRTLIATIISEFMSPIRLSNARCARTQLDALDNERGIALIHEKRSNNDIESGEDNEALKLLCEFSRWLAVFPIAVKIYLRPDTREGWNSRCVISDSAFFFQLLIITQLFINQMNRATYAKKRFEIGPLLSDDDAGKVIKEYDDEDGTPTYDSSSGVRRRDPPLVVLNRLHELAYNLAHFPYNDDVGLFMPTAPGRAIFHQKISDQINILFSAYGAMERIMLTPLPFVYTIHLRSFLLIYLFLWNMIMVAKYEWVVRKGCQLAVGSLNVDEAHVFISLCHFSSCSIGPFLG
jgi:hypothetical protein